MNGSWMTRSLLVLALTVILTTPVRQAGAGTRAIVVESGIAGELSEELAVLENDYIIDGAEVAIIEVPAAQPFSSWTSHVWVRNQLNAIPDLEGAILIGNVPTAFMGSNRDHARPSDLPYRLPRATFRDSNGDNVYDSMYGEVTTAIPIGRVTPVASSWSGRLPLEQIRFYLNRLHEHRAGLLAPVAVRSLNYIDSPFGRGTQLPATDDLERLYDPGDVTTVADADYGQQFDVTTHQNYRARIEEAEGWEFVCLHAHGDPGEQEFNLALLPPGGDVRTGCACSQDYRFWHPNVNFYLLGSCSNYNYTHTFSGSPQIASDNVAASALLWGNSTLGVIANTFSGSFDRYEEFFLALDAGAGIGLALNYAQLHFTEPLDPGESISMTQSGSIQYHLLGDPWLKSRAADDWSGESQYTMLYWQSGWLAATVESILNAIGTPIPNAKKDVFFWTMPDLIMDLADHWEVRDTHYFNYGTIWFPRWLPRTRTYDVPFENVYGHWGVWIASPTGTPRGATYSVRPVFWDGNRGGWTPGCRVEHPYAMDQYTICD